MKKCPRVSIILPTYNRAAFLPQAFDSIRSQTFTDWELIVVDDGSTDETETIVRQWNIPQGIRYVKQANQGPSAARNAGLDLAFGEYIAFFDSDDLWLPHHLRDCVDALNANPNVDWVYAACRLVRAETNQIVEPSSFYTNGVARPFLRLKVKEVGRLRILIDDDAVRCQILDGLYCGLQASVIRRRIFNELRLPEFRVGEDQALTIKALSQGYRLAYVDAVHVLYRIHEANSSSAAINSSTEKRVGAYLEQSRCLESLHHDARLTKRESRALRRRLSRDYFWVLGYALLWRQGRREEAMKMFRHGLRLWPWDWRYWKTYLGALTRTFRGVGVVSEVF
jgi:glycosyltransferase involved in cell wall biosynthesis